MAVKFGVVDLFAGPGGLGEGFSAFQDQDGNHPFSVEVSIEKDRAAHSTLLLRSFLRKFGYGHFPSEYYDYLNGAGDAPDWSRLYPDEWEAATREAWHLELGAWGTDKLLKSRIDSIRNKYGEMTILIGGPPCQAYSIVGRARNKGNATYLPHTDDRHFLYQRYVKVLKQLNPAVFVMENVRGMLSSAVWGDPIFFKILADLRSAAGKGSYQLSALSVGGQEYSNRVEPEPRDYIVKMEQHGIPQTRHRVIIVGIHQDFVSRLAKDDWPTLMVQEPPVTVNDVISNMPRLRSGLSRNDDPSAWKEAIREAIDCLLNETAPIPRPFKGPFQDVLRDCKRLLRTEPLEDRISQCSVGHTMTCPPHLHSFLVDDRLTRLPNNATRGHMPSDLARYLFASAFGQVVGRSPKASEFPDVLAPAHSNWNSGYFSDRFRVQVADKPATTVTSHISKDGHYFIHPDPTQCRSLTVREAARLQTFPDNYLFKGNRTEQYVQVGNAVPPFLARQVAESLWKGFGGFHENTETAFEQSVPSAVAHN